MYIPVMSRRNILAALILTLIASICFALPVNLLQDASFDDGMLDTPFSSNWMPFGQAHCVSDDARTGVYCAKLFGNFRSEQNWSGLYQDVPVTPGKKYIANGYLRQNTGDRLEGGSLAWIKLEFYDAEDNQLMIAESPVRLGARSAANRWLFFSTSPVIAPGGAVKVRVVAIFEQQSDNAPGAVLVDDLTLRPVD